MAYGKTFYIVVQVGQEGKPFSLGSWRTRQEAETAKRRAMDDLMDRFPDSWYGPDEVFARRVRGDFEYIEKTRYEVLAVTAPEEREPLSAERK